MKHDADQNQLYTLEAIELSNKKALAATYTSACLQSDSIEPTSVFSTKAVQNLAQAIENYNNTNLNLKHDLFTEHQTANHHNTSTTKNTNHLNEDFYTSNNTFNHQITNSNKELFMATDSINSIYPDNEQIPVSTYDEYLAVQGNNDYEDFNHEQSNYEQQNETIQRKQQNQTKENQENSNLNQHQTATADDSKRSEILQTPTENEEQEIIDVAEETATPNTVNVLNKNQHNEYQEEHKNDQPSSQTTAANIKQPANNNDIQDDDLVVEQNNSTTADDESSSEQTATSPQQAEQEEKTAQTTEKPKPKQRRKQSSQSDDARQSTNSANPTNKTNENDQNQDEQQQQTNTQNNNSNEDFANLATADKIARIENLVTNISSGWATKPDIVIVENEQDVRLPQSIQQRIVQEQANSPITGIFYPLFSCSKS